MEQLRTIKKLALKVCENIGCIQRGNILNSHIPRMQLGTLSIFKHLWLFCRTENSHSFWSKDKALEKYKCNLKELLVSIAICIQKKLFLKQPSQNSN